MANPNDSSSSSNPTSDESSFSPSSPTPLIKLQTFCLCSRMFGAKTQAKVKDTVTTDMKLRNHHPKEEEEESEISTELKLSCDFWIKSEKPMISETNSSVGECKRKEPNLCTMEENHAVNEVSTKLTLFNQSWTVKRKTNDEIMFEKREHVSKIVKRCKDEEEERHRSVSAGLQHDESPWKIKKTLHESDIGGCSRLMLGIDLVQTNILPNFDAVRVGEIESNEGTRVTIWDQDTESEHQLSFKRWRSSKSYVFMNKWRKEFVKRRELKEGDEIGFYWDPNNFRFCFSVLNRT